MGLQRQQRIFHHCKLMEEINDLKGPPQSKARAAVALHSGNVPPEEGHFPAEGRQLPCDHIEQGGLAGAVRPDDNNSWASLIQGERNVFQHQ